MKYLNSILTVIAVALTMIFSTLILNTQKPQINQKQDSSRYYLFNGKFKAISGNVGIDEDVLLRIDT